MPRAQRSDMTPEHRMKKPNGIFIVLFIALLLSLARGWRYMNATERRLQVILAFPIITAAVTTTVLPKSSYERYRTPALILCRFTAALMPSFVVLIKRLMLAENSLSKKWGRNRLGAIGLVLFSSRGLILGVSSIAMPLDFLPTLAVQLIIGAASWPTNLGLCTARIASTPEVLLWLDAIHSFFSIIWGVCMPFFWTPLPPHNVIRPGVSLFAVTLFVQFCAAGFPVVQSLFRESQEYWVHAAQQQRRLMSSRRHRNINSSSNTTTYDDDDDDDDEDEDVDYIERFNRRRRNASLYTTMLNSIENLANENRVVAGTSATDNYLLPASSPFPSNTAGSEFKGPPLAAKICICYQNVLRFPAHAAWLFVVVGCLMWTLSYAAAEKMCA